MENGKLPDICSTKQNQKDKKLATTTYKSNSGLGANSNRFCIYLNNLDLLEKTVRCTPFRRFNSGHGRGARSPIFPMTGRERGEIRIGLRSVIKENHVVFYRIVKSRVRIVRILHGSRDLPKYF